jgi:hypothetical protein
MVLEMQSPAASPSDRACLLGGAATSIAGMFCRWLSYETEKRRGEK